MDPCPICLAFLGLVWVFRKVVRRRKRASKLELYRAAEEAGQMRASGIESFPVSGRLPLMARDLKDPGLDRNYKPGWAKPVNKD